MSRILLVDDSPHAQRIGERILTEEGYEVVTVSNADTALVRIEDVDPDVVIADAVMPGRTGYEICQYLKMNPRHRHVRVVLTAGVLEPIDEGYAQRVEADASIKKPFEASALVNTVRPLADAAAKDRAAHAKPGAGGRETGAGAIGDSSVTAPFVAVVDEEQVRAAVTVALDASMDAIVAEISRRVVAALQTKQAEAPKSSEAGPLESALAAPGGAMAAAADRAAGPMAHRGDYSVRRINPLRVRASILGLEAGESEPESSPES